MAINRESLNDWDMCFNRNLGLLAPSSILSLNDWDMCFNRNLTTDDGKPLVSLNDWDMCFNRNRKQILIWAISV